MKDPMATCEARGRGVDRLKDKPGRPSEGLVTTSSRAEVED